MFDAASASDRALERADGAARLRFARRGSNAFVKERYASSPARILRPAAYDGPPEAVLANTSGGLAGGDRLSVVVSVESGAEGVVSGQAAERVYRAIDRPAEIRTILSVAAGGALQWLPQETILFDGGQLERRIDVKLGEGARLLMTEALVFGREAFAERFDHGCITDIWRIDGPGGPLWRERLRIDGGGRALASAAGINGARGLATIICADPEPEYLLEAARDALKSSEMNAGATLVRGLVVVRLLAREAGAMKAELGRIVGLLRAAAFGGPALPPRVWMC